MSSVSSASARDSWAQSSFHNPLGSLALSRSLNILPFSLVEDYGDLTDTRSRTSAVTHSSSSPSSIEEDIKHQILTEKANMKIKPHLPGACRDYKIMVHQENDFKNLPEWDKSAQCVMLDMIESKCNFAQAHGILEEIQKKRVLTRIERDEEIKELKHGQIALRDSFIHFDSFIKGNIYKRNRALERIEAEKNVKPNLDRQINQADMKIKKLIKIKENMLQAIADRKVFVDFLEAVRAKSPTYYGNSIQEIIDRFELLLQVREELARKRVEAIVKYRDLSNKIFQKTNEHTQFLINLQTEVCKLRVHYQKVKQENFHLESLVNTVTDLTVKQSRILEKSKLACWDLYLLICKNNNLKVTLKRNQIIKQLKVIEDTILLLKRVKSEKIIHLIKQNPVKI